MKEFIYRKGDVFLADLGIPHGSERGGRRPVVIIQNDDGCVYSPTITMVPMTTAIKKPFQKSHYILRYSDCIDCFKENAKMKEIKNIKQYLKAAIFNAPATIDSYFTAMVQRDIYGY